MSVVQSGVSARAKRAIGLAAVAGVAGLALGPAAMAQEQAAVGEAVPTAGHDHDGDRDHDRGHGRHDRDRDRDNATEVSGLDVYGAREKADSPKYTAALRDTPQTITVISSETIAAQNLMGLRDILSTQPGITFGAGEGGGGYGDSINLRGYSANSDITVDGVRDSAQYTRSDPFNYEQVEVINGANSVYSGSGSVGGTINIVTKTPTAMDRTTVSAGVGTDNYGRLTLDANKVLSDGVAVRLNVMAHRNDAPGRDVEQYKRWGVAPSIAFGLGTPTRVTLSYLHQKDDNIPQYGVPYYVNGIYDGPLPGVDPSNYYGYSNVDKQKIGLDSYTLRLEHEFNGDFSVRNLTRYEEVTQFSRVDPPQGTWCLANGLTPANASCGAVPVGFYQPSGPRGTTRDSKNTIFYSQTDFAGRFETGGIEHNFVAGFSFSSEDYHLDSGNSERNPDGATPNPVLPPMNIADPDNVYTGPLNFVVNSRRDGSLKDRAVYLFDTAKLSQKFELNFGLRYERSEGEYVTTSIATPYPSTGPVETPSPVQRNSDDLFSYRAGLVFKPMPTVSLYVAYGNTKTPSQVSVNGGCTEATCNVDPEKGKTIEIGGKWDALDGRLLLTAALFRNERTNYKVPSGDPTIPDQVLDGKSRVDGLALGATGRIAERWSVFANYTYLDSEVLQSVSDLTLATTGIDAQKGHPLTNTPKHSGSLWVTYDLPGGVTLGYGVTYQGAFYLNNGAAPLFKSQGYWVHSAMATYQINERIGLQLNVKNIFDKEYYIRGRNNGWATPGDTRNAQLTLNYRF